MRWPFHRRTGTPKLKTPDDKMTLRDHLAELRSRIVRSALAAALGFTVILIWYKEVLDFLTKPYGHLCNDGTITGIKQQTATDLCRRCRMALEAMLN